MDAPLRLTQETTGSSPPQRDPIRVLFIAGAARSGSTLLDRVIGKCDGFCSTGELQFIWQRSFRENQLCGCGVPFHECAFWREVSLRAFGVETPQVDETAAVHLKASLDRKWRLPWLLLKQHPRSQSALAAYGDLLERLYEAILHVSGARVIVDSSKDPRHGLVLSKLERFEVHVVHLVRDPRGVAFSWTRTRTRPEIHWRAQNMMTQRVRSSTARWVTHNAVAELLSASAASHCRVRYMDFIANPAAELSRILAPYEWVDRAPEIVTGAHAVLEPTHTVSGNPMRFRAGALDIKLDAEWCTSMPLRSRVAIAAATWPLLARYGYVRDPVRRSPARSRTATENRVARGRNRVS